MQYFSRSKIAQGLFALNLKYVLSVLNVDIIITIYINCRLSISRLVNIAFSHKLESNENHLKHYVLSSRHEIKR
jgi:hypothetical protein